MIRCTQMHFIKDISAKLCCVHVWTTATFWFSKSLPSGSQ